MGRVGSVCISPHDPLPLHLFLPQILVSSRAAGQPEHVLLSRGWAWLLSEVDHIQHLNDL